MAEKMKDRKGYFREYRIANRKKIAQYNRRQDVRARTNRRQKELRKTFGRDKWDLANREYYRQKSREWYLANRDKVKKKNQSEEERQKKRKWYEANREKRNALKRAWRAAHPHRKEIESAREWRIANREHIKQWKRIYRAAHIDETRESDNKRSSQWYLANREKALEQSRKRYYANREKLIAQSVEYKRRKKEHTKWLVELRKEYLAMAKQLNQHHQPPSLQSLRAFTNRLNMELERRLKSETPSPKPPKKSAPAKTSIRRSRRR